MKCIIFSVEFILSCGNSLEKFLILKEYIEGVMGKFPVLLKKHLGTSG